MNLSEAFLFQARACEDLGSPFMGRLMRLAEAHLDPHAPVGQVMHNWPGDVGPSAGSLPLRLAGGLHALKLAGNASLLEAYPPNDVRDDALWFAVQTAMRTEEDFLLDWLTRAPQTNEVRRSVALIPAALLTARLSGLPLALLELGASAGLNLYFDQYGLAVPGRTLGPPEPALTLRPEWRGETPLTAPLQVVSRRGVDLAPIDPSDPVGQRRLLAYLWADQPERAALTRAAIAIARTEVCRGDAADWLARNLDPVRGAVRFVFHTVAWQYFPPDTQARARNVIEAAGRAATANTPLAWFSMESANDMKGAALSLRFWPGDLRFDLGRADFHGRWLDWRTPAL